MTAAVIGTLLGLAGAVNHGLFEIMQGSTATDGLFIEAIGPAQRYWTYGTEGAITVIPNFLLTGIAVLLVSLAVIVWSVKYMQTRHGATVFLLLMLSLTMVGGGLGHIVLFLPAWAYATRIRKPLSWWRRILSADARAAMAGLWKPTLVLAAISWLMVMELGIFGYFPLQTNPNAVLNITFGFVLLSVALANMAFICAFARDLEQNVVHAGAI
jgi:hypothetical protein